LKALEQQAWAGVEEAALHYEDPVHEGPGYQCPLENCHFRTDLEVFIIFFIEFVSR